MVRTRIAPSPTGEDLHIGNVYTALINYAFAKKNDGEFFIRIEDTDQKRKIQGSEERILDSLKWFGLNPDGKVIRQSERLSIYKKYAEQLVSDGHAYFCDCSPERLSDIRKQMLNKGVPPKYDRYCFKRQDTVDKSKAVIRMLIPDEIDGEHAISWKDEIGNFIIIENSILDDQVILKSDGYPTYHLAVVVDDHLMGITHVIRAVDWISSTPKHILLYRYFGWEMPAFAHTPLLRNPDKSKLSKRKNPVWASWYRENGFLPKAILNYLATLGWSHPEGKDKFELSDFIKYLELKDIQKTGPVFDLAKLSWINGEYIREMDTSELASNIVNYESKRHSEVTSVLVEQTIPLVQTRMKTLGEYWPMCAFFYRYPETYEQDVNKEWMATAADGFETLKKWDHTLLYETGTRIAEGLGVSKSKFFMDVRIAISGKKIGPPLFESMELLGKEECLARLRRA